MNDKQRRRTDRAGQVSDFIGSLPRPFAEGSKGAQSAASINQHIAKVAELDAAYSTSLRIKRAGTSTKEDLRKKLLDALRRIKRTADTLGMDHPEMKGKFRLAVGKLNDQALLSAARSFITEATPIKALFIEYGLPADFLDRLGEMVVAFDESINQQNKGTGGSAFNSASIDTELDLMDAEIARLDTIITNTYADDAATLRAWKVAKHMERTPRAKKDKPDQEGK